MQKAPVLKGSGLAPVEDEPVHVFGRNLEQRVVESRGDESEDREDQADRKEEIPQEDDVETIKKRKFETITGEEDEETILQGDFKLFSWCLDTSNWIEKGRGQLRLNDSADQSERRSRLIMRTGGTYRIILNVAIKHPFFKVISNTKTNIRFTNSETVWAASGSNAGQLADLIRDRLAEDAKNAPADCEKTPIRKSITDETRSLSEDTAASTEEGATTTKKTPTETEDAEASTQSTQPSADEGEETSEDTRATTDKTKSSSQDSETNLSVDRAESPVAGANSNGEPYESSNESVDEITGTPESSKSRTVSADSPLAAATSTTTTTGSAGRRHSGSSETSGEEKTGAKKLKKSSD